MYKNSKVLVTGASGLLGSHLVEKLSASGADVKAVIHKRDPLFKKNQNIKTVRGDLTNPDFCSEVCEDIDFVFHLAVETGSISKNAKHPASIMTPTILMDFNMLKSAHEKKVSRYMYSSCACVYPHHIENMDEKSAWDGPPPKMHETISWSKRISELQCQSFQKEFGDNISIVRPSNTYGPYDHFDIENSHVISAFIKKAFLKTDPFVIWGNGEQIREFVFAGDVVDGMMLALEKNSKEPINLAGGTAIKVKDLAEKIISITGYNPKIEFDQNKPSGHMKRILDSKKSKSELGFQPNTNLDEGLLQTIKWYKKQEKM